MVQPASTPPRHSARRAVPVLDRFLDVEALSGIVLLVSAAAALIWANSPAARSYHALWTTPLLFGVADYQFSQSLHFFINDGLMTVFFLVAGLEIRREIHNGALATRQLAALPLVAALGGVVVPAFIYFSLNAEPVQREGWAVPTATDIAFAVGVLALLGRSIPANVRALLLALAVIDDIVAVVIIAIFFSDGIQYGGLLIAGAGVAMVLAMQRAGIGSAYAYVLPGAMLWIGLLQGGVHPTMAGVVLGLMTPVKSVRRSLTRGVARVNKLLEPDAPDHRRLNASLTRLRRAHRELVPPVTRVELALHPWVAFGVMPLFALANAGIDLNGLDLSAAGSQPVLWGVCIALVLGKPLGVMSASWLAVRVGWCDLPPGVTWSGITMIGLLAGIGFTMSIFIAMLAFHDENLLVAAKFGVVLASGASALLGLTWGKIYLRRLRSCSATKHC